jgi:hypothetical protein
VNVGCQNNYQAKAQKAPRKYFKKLWGLAALREILFFGVIVVLKCVEGDLLNKRWKLVHDPTGNGEASLV